MPRKGRREEPDANTEAWMMTFMDLLTLLLTFFVLVFSMCSLEAGKIEELQDSLRSVLGVLEMGKSSDYNIEFPIVTSNSVDMESSHGDKLLDHQDGSESASRLSKLRTELKSLSTEEDMGFKVTKEGANITMADKILFDLGVAEINPAAFPFLNRVASIVKGNPYFRVLVEGHTDNLPIKTERFPSNWELSIARSVNVVKYFLKDNEISPSRLSAVGYGESKPILPNYTAKFRAKNRRVEILFSAKEEGK